MAKQHRGSLGADPADAEHRSTRRCEYDKPVAFVQWTPLATLRYFEDLSRQEIATVLQLPESVVKSRLYEARKELARRLA